MSEVADEFSDLIEYELRTIYQEEDDVGELLIKQKQQHIKDEVSETGYATGTEVVMPHDEGGERDESPAQLEEEMERTYVDDEVEFIEHLPLLNIAATKNAGETTETHAVEEVPSHKRNSVASSVVHTGPHRFLLYDSLVAEIVDYDDEDDAPIVEFSMCANDADEDKLPVECGICPDVMHKSKINRHMRTHMKPGTKRYMCIYCDDDFVSRTYAAGHARRHMGIRPYVCEPCKLYYCTKQDLRVHQQRRHLAKEHICEQCGKTFAQNTALTNHRMLVHEKKRRFACEHCGKRFLRNYAMKEHVRNVHLGDRRLLDCPFCDQRFRDTHKLAQHRKDAHLNQSLFECRACGLGFTHIDFFDAHRRSLQCREKYKRVDDQQQDLEDYVKLECEESKIMPMLKLEQMPLEAVEAYAVEYLVAAEQQQQLVEYMPQELLLEVKEDHAEDDNYRDIIVFEVDSL